MIDRLKNVLSFDLDAGETVVIPHGLIEGQGRRLTPDIIFVPSASLTVSADDVAVTLTNGDAPMAGDILVEAWHTIERAFGAIDTVDLPVKPYIVVTSEGGNALPQPAWPDNPPVIITRFVRDRGSDLTGDGSFANPYRTVQHAYRTIPLYIPPGVRYVVDCSGENGVKFVETFPSGYTPPAWHSACSFDLINANEDPLTRRRAGVKTRADLQVYSPLSVAEATITGLDGTLGVVDPLDKLYTYTNNFDVDAWAPNKPTGVGVTLNVTNGLVTLTSGTADYTADMIGNEILIENSGNPANDGPYLVQSIVGASPSTQVKFVNVNAVDGDVVDWSVEIGILKGQIWKASNADGLGDARIAYNTRRKIVLTVSNSIGCQTPVFPAVIMEESAVFQGTSAAADAAGLAIPAAINLANVDSHHFLGIYFVNLDGPGSPSVGIRSNSSIYGFSYCSFASELDNQGVSPYRQIFEFCHMFGGWRWQPSGAGMTINTSLFDGLTGVGTTPNAGYMTLQNSVWQNCSRPLGEFQPLVGGNFGQPVNSVGGGLQLWARHVRVQNMPPNSIGASGGAAMLLNAGGEINETAIRACATNGAVVSQSIGPIAATGINSDGNVTGIGLIVAKHSTVDRKPATAITGLGGDYKVGSNPVRAAGSWATFTAEDDFIQHLLDRSGFTADNVTDQLTVANHGLATGDGPIVFPNDGAGTLPAGLLHGKDYWAIRVTEDTFQVAESRSQALGGVAFDFTDDGAGTPTVESRQSELCLMYTS